MQRRSPGNNYTHPGVYHITITVSDRKVQSLGHVVGDLQYPDGHPDAPKVELTAIGKMVEYELLHSISSYYPFIEVQDYVIMPDHMHFILNVFATSVPVSGAKKQRYTTGRQPLFSLGYVDIIPLKEGQPCITLQSSVARCLPS